MMLYILTDCLSGPASRTIRVHVPDAQVASPWTGLIYSFGSSWNALYIGSSPPVALLVLCTR